MIKFSQVETHILSIKICTENCLVDINVLIAKEGCSEAMPVFNSKEEIIDMDFVEAVLARAKKRNQSKSMDSVFVIKSDSENTNQAVLTEFRFNYENLKNLKKQDLFGKVAGSTIAINGKESIHPKYYFIFKSNLRQQAIRRFRNMNPSMPNNFIATDIVGLKALFF